MFDKLMLILKRGGAVTVDQMARELDTSPEMIAGAIDHMERAGWLRQMSVSCDAQCNQCVFVGDCQGPSQSRVWRAND